MELFLLYVRYSSPCKTYQDFSKTPQGESEAAILSLPKNIKFMHEEAI